MTTPRVVITESLNDVGIRALAKHTEVVSLNRAAPAEELRNSLLSADVIVTQVMPIGRALIDSTDRLKLIAKHGTGVDNIDVAAATSRGIGVINAPGANARSVAEHTLAMMLSVARQLPELDAAVRHEHFDLRHDLQLHDLSGRTVSVIGAGRTGRTVLDLCCGVLGMRGIAFDIAPLQPGDLPDRCSVAESLNDALIQADFLTIHLPLTPQTRGLIGKEELARLPPDAIVVNVGRGGVVKEDALAQAVSSGALAGAAVDVFEDEPPTADNPLLHLPRIQVSPHAAGLSQGASHAIADQLARDILTVLEGGKPKHAVNPDVFPVHGARNPQSR